MSDVVIRVEHLSKRYTIQHRNGDNGLRHAIHDFATAPLRWLRGQLSAVRSQQSANNGNGVALSASNSRLHAPASAVGSLTSTIRPLTSDLRSLTSDVRPPTSEEFWALKDVSFEVKQGEVVGIIGRNGAGKSTLLKILSRITEPTEGRVRIRGRVASLLEVGTGFHPELTGRENIFVNGAILGMTRVEIAKKFDEIVAFAEIEKFLDMPVKRYSSGMYVRLAFAVAAHLDPEILIVDEVLAVGDAEFQKKCLGKMSQVARHGRTVLFVSHNLAAVKSLTTHCIVLDDGRIVFSGATGSAIKFYTNLPNRSVSPAVTSWGQGAHTTICEARLLDETGKPTTNYTPGQPFRLEIAFTTDGTSNLSLDGFLLDESHAKIAYLSDYQFHGRTLPVKAGLYIYHLELAGLWLASGTYWFDVTTAVAKSNWDHYVESAIEFEVLGYNPCGLPWDFRQLYGYGQLALISDTVSWCECLTPVLPMETEERSKSVNVSPKSI